MEQWKPIPDYPDYEISDAGRVRRTTPGQGTAAGRLRKVSPRNRGYLTVTLYRNGKRKTHDLHVLVMRTFVGACPDGLEINHKDGIKAHCSLSNLEYITHADNVKHARETGLVRQLDAIDKDRICELDREGVSQAVIGSLFNIGKRHVRTIVSRGKRA